MSATYPYTVRVDSLHSTSSITSGGGLGGGCGPFSIAYGELSLDKICATLKTYFSDNSNAAVTLKTQALEQTILLLKKPENVTRIITTGVFLELVLSCGSESVECRKLATEALEQASRSRNGRDRAISSNLWSRLETLCSDVDATVRKNAVLIIYNIVQEQRGIKEIIENKLLKLLVQKVADEDVLTVKHICLDVLSVCLRHPLGWQVSLDNGLISICTTILHALMSIGADAALSVSKHEGVISTEDKPLFDTISMCCKVLALCAVDQKGKDQCVTSGAVPLLVRLLDDHPVSMIRCEASLALQNISLSESGKKACLTSNAIPVLLAHINDSEPMVCAHSMQAIASVVELPASKADGVLRSEQVLTQLRDIEKNHTHHLVTAAAKVALEKILWEP